MFLNQFLHLPATLLSVDFKNLVFSICCFRIFGFFPNIYIGKKKQNPKSIIGRHMLDLQLRDYTRSQKLLTVCYRRKLPTRPWTKRCQSSRQSSTTTAPKKTILSCKYIVSCAVLNHFVTCNRNYCHTYEIEKSTSQSLGSWRDIPQRPCPNFNNVLERHQFFIPKDSLQLPPQGLLQSW